MEWRFLSPQKGNRFKTWCGVLCVSFVTWGLSGVLMAQADTANLNLTLTIVEPPQCVLGSGESSYSHDFGQVEQGLIDNVGYKRQTLDYVLRCNSGHAVNGGTAFKLIYQWNEVVINGQSAIRTNRSNFGIAVFYNGTRLSNNGSVNFQWTPAATYPKVDVMPVKPTGMMLTDAGTFNGSMTMTIDYQ